MFIASIWNQFISYQTKINNTNRSVNASLKNVAIHKIINSKVLFTLKKTKVARENIIQNPNECWKCRPSFIGLGSWLLPMRSSGLFPIVQLTTAKLNFNSSIIAFRRDKNFTVFFIESDRVQNVLCNSNKFWNLR